MNSRIHTFGWHSAEMNLCKSQPLVHTNLIEDSKPSFLYQSTNYKNLLILLSHSNPLDLVIHHCEIKKEKRKKKRKKKKHERSKEKKRIEETNHERIGIQDKVSK